MSERSTVQGEPSAPNLLCCSDWAVVTTAELAAPCIFGTLDSCNKRAEALSADRTFGRKLMKIMKRVLKGQSLLSTI